MISGEEINFELKNHNIDPFIPKPNRIMLQILHAARVVTIAFTRADSVMYYESCAV